MATRRSSGPPAGLWRARPSAELQRPAANCWFVERFEKARFPSRHFITTPCPRESTGLRSVHAGSAAPICIHRSTADDRFLFSTSSVRLAVRRVAISVPHQSASVTVAMNPAVVSAAPASLEPRCRRCWLSGSLTAPMRLHAEGRGPCLAASLGLA